MVGRRFLPWLAFAAFAAVPACVSPGEGPSPHADGMYFPVGLAISPGGHTMYVANSDFDLQFNGGTIVALDLDRIRSNIPPLWDTEDPDYPCGELSVNTTKLLYPGTCSPINLTNPPDGQGSIVSDSVEIGAFATDIITVAQQDGPGVRLFVPVRGDPSITWIDVEDDRDGAPARRRLSCGGSRCDQQHRAGEDPDTNLRRVVLPPEPYGITASEDGLAIVVTHQTTGSMSLLTNDWDGIPTLQFVSGGFPAGGVGVAPLPVPRYTTSVKDVDYQPAFLATFRAASEVDLVRYYDDTAASPERPFIVRAGAAGITVNASGVDSRGIAIDATERRACEASCGDEASCLQACAAVPADVYIANRAPPSLLIGETRSNVSPTGSDDLVTIYDSIPLTFGASRVVFGSVVNRDGEREPRVFVSCFDARYIFIYNPVSRRVDGQVRTGRGPHAMVLDPTEPYLYVAHFTDSYIGVIDLDQRHTATYPSIIASVGVPLPPRESK